MIRIAEFAADDRDVEVNEGDEQSALTLTVERVGGAVGVVQVQWNLTTSSGMSYTYKVALSYSISSLPLCL